jgi:2-oxoisovalerate dehydrogenase E1 component
MFAEQGVPEGYYEIDLSEPSIKRAGRDLTIITFGPALYTAVEAANVLAAKYGLSVELIDLRTANPINYAPVIESVKKTGKVVLASDACERGSVVQSVAANITQLAFDYLDAPPAVVGSRNWITPAAELETMFFPQKEWILDTIHERVIPLKDHVPTTNQALGELVRRSRLGV